MAANLEGRASARATHTRNYKEIVSPQYEISDPSKADRNLVGITCDKNGCILATDLRYSEVCIFNKNGKLLQVIPISDEDVSDIVALENNTFAISKMSEHAIAKYTYNGELIKEFGPEFEIFKSPFGLAVNEKQGFVVVSHEYPKVYVFSKDGDLLHTFVSESPDVRTYLQCFVVVDKDGLIWLTDNCKGVFVFHQDGKFVRRIDVGIVKDATGICITNEGMVLVVSQTQKKVFFLTSTGECLHEVCNVGLKEPGGIAVDSNGFIYVANGEQIVVL